MCRPNQSASAVRTSNAKFTDRSSETSRRAISFAHNSIGDAGRRLRQDTSANRRPYLLLQRHSGPTQGPLGVTIVWRNNNSRQLRRYLTAALQRLPRRFKSKSNKSLAAARRPAIPRQLCD